MENVTTHQAEKKDAEVGHKGKAVGFVIIVFLAVAWLWTADFKSFSQNPAVALGFNMFSVGLPAWLLWFGSKRLYRALNAGGAASPYKLTFGTICVSCLLLALYDLFGSATPSKIGAALFVIIFGMVSVILFGMAYRQHAAATGKEHRLVNTVHIRPWDRDTMSKAIGFLLPWRNTFRRLQLEKRWWHRLATVLFFVALTPTLLYSWVIADDTPANRFDSDIHDWGGGPDGMLFDLGSSQPPPGGTFDDAPVPNSNSQGGAYTLPAGVTLDQSTSQPIQSSGSQTSPPTPDANGFSIGPPQPPKPPPTIQKTIEMPDGKTVTYPGTTSDETINAEWKHRLNIATTKAAVFGFGWAVLVTVRFSYLLQAAYRALVYVIYGGKAGRPAPDSPAAG